MHTNWIFNLGHNYTNCVTVTDGHRRVQWDRNTRLHNSFFRGRERMAQPVSSLSRCNVWANFNHRTQFKQLMRKQTLTCWSSITTELKVNPGLIVLGDCNIQRPNNFSNILLFEKLFWCWVLNLVPIEQTHAPTNSATLLPMHQIILQHFQVLLEEEGV
jgi:hypothetical protein